MKHKTVSNLVFWQFSAVFLVILLLIGTAYLLISGWYAQKHFEEATQRLHAQVASHLINEKFQEDSPFLADGSVNKPLFGDIMHDMMAVNRNIEVYLLDTLGNVLYSVVLDHDLPGAPKKQVSLEPIEAFIALDGQGYVLGDDPRQAGRQKIFSAARFTADGREGIIYIILAGKEWEKTSASLAGGYYLQLGTGAFLLTIVFAALLGLLAIWYLTRNLRALIFVVTRFKEGDLQARAPAGKGQGLAVLAETFNQMADTIVKNIGQLKAVENLRRELIANVSHDLRTPLAIVQGYVETLQLKQGNLSAAEKSKYLGIILNSITRLSGMIQQLFEFSKLEARQVEPQKEPFLLADLAQDIFAKNEVLARKQQIDLILDLGKSNSLVFADVGMVERAIQNLVDNALKFTPAGGSITIALRHEQTSITLLVSDTGPGIPETDQQYIFERYRKVGPGKAKQGHGAGLGLAIVKKIMEIHNATVGVVSQPDKGATFHFSLPVHSW